MLHTIPMHQIHKIKAKGLLSLKINYQRYISNSEQFKIASKFVNKRFVQNKQFFIRLSWIVFNTL